MSFAARLIGLLALLALLLPLPALAQNSATLPDLEDEVMCPVCGTTLGMAESPQAERQRVFIRELIDDGLGKDEIKDELVAEYGREVLATPDTSGFDLAAWVVPGLAVIVAAGALVIGLRRWRRRGDDGDEGPDAATPRAGSDPADEERLSADLGRYEL